MYFRVDKSVATSTWAFFFFTSPKGMHALLSNRSQTGVPAIARPTTSLKAIKVTLPPLELLHKFESIVEPLTAKRTMLDNENQTLSSLRDTLLPKLISGELPIKNAEKFLEQAGI